MGMFWKKTCDPPTAALACGFHQQAGEWHSLQPSCRAKAAPALSWSPRPAISQRYDSPTMGLRYHPPLPASMDLCTKVHARS